MRYPTIVLAFVAVLVITLLAACGAQSDPADPSTLDGQALVQERCSECHPVTRVTEASKTREAWQQTVERMLANGARLDEAQQQAVIEYLAEAHPAS